MFQRHNRKRLTAGMLPTVLSTIWIILALPIAASAHRVNIFAWIEGNKVHAESKFSGGRAPKGALVEVYDLAGAKLLEGRTDENGAFSFTPPEWKAMRIVLIAGQGHQGEWTLSEDEIAAQGFSPAPENTQLKETELAEQSPARPEEIRASSMTVSETEFERIVETALDKKLAPIRHQLKKMEEASSNPGVKDVMAGIGYILGIVGLAAYLHARKRTNQR